MTLNVRKVLEQQILSLCIILITCMSGGILRISWAIVRLKFEPRGIFSILIAQRHRIFFVQHSLHMTMEHSEMQHNLSLTFIAVNFHCETYRAIYESFISGKDKTVTHVHVLQWAQNLNWIRQSRVYSLLINYLSSSDWNWWNQEKLLLFRCAAASD